MIGPSIAAAIALAGFGIWAMATGFQPRPVRYTPRRRPGPRGAATKYRLWLRVAAMIVGGVAVYVITGWLTTLVLVPLAIWALPKLFGQAPPTDIPVLEALDKWLRTLSTLMMQGDSALNAIRASVPSTPELLKEDVAILIRQLDSQLTPEEALRRFADRLDSAETDGPVASLLLAATKQQKGASDNLISIADGIQRQLETLRLVEAERSKPRHEVRQVSIAVLAMLTALAFFARAFLQPLASPAGQVFVVTAALIYTASVWKMHQITKPRRRPRILISDAGELR